MAVTSLGMGRLLGSEKYAILRGAMEEAKVHLLKQRGVLAVL